VGDLIKDINLIDEGQEKEEIVSSSKDLPKKNGRKLYIESYGCQMNFADSEVVSSILRDEGFKTTNDFESADLILVNTCSIRDKAEQTVRNRLRQFNTAKKKKPELVVGVLGCMAED
jgi:tRNA-2-methylthio-N6-dimethylallyladenosine synthase